MGRGSLGEVVWPLLLAELAGDEHPLEDYLVANSYLPGPAGNLSLAQAIATAMARAAIDEPERVWQLLARWAHVPLEEAPVNHPREMLPATAALGRGAVAAAVPAYRSAALAALRAQARDQRWRTRELVAHGLQALLRADFATSHAALAVWVRGGDLLELRAVAAAVAEPSVLVTREQTQAALAFHAEIVNRVLEVPEQERRGEPFRALRQGLGYTLSVVVAAAPQDGFVALWGIAAIPDADVRWILRENLKKARTLRLLQAHPEYWPDYQTVSH